MNNAIEIEVGAPLLRPGLTLRTKVSERYAERAVDQLMGIVRSVNRDSAPAAGTSETKVDG